ncbi:efflux RND transporter periplasmic adaptor subunit [Aridibaculum aurantiacum]|uniref:efflux RND transporter periplasmic adaptor subunit n=1 Tax=Aridibaculum aurantiacum TaxID=2810307 RepID=UPI001A96E40C|nr:efflux RND transporter periplasmic adaptor subunit [Aridibaculum aurantiacum]
MKYFSIFLSLFILSCHSKKETKETKQQGPQATTVDVLVVNPQTVTNTVEANGTIVAGESVDVRPEISGRITYLSVNEGSRVAKGAVIARINDADLRAQLNKIKVQLDLARTTVDRYKKLLDIQGINRADYDLAVNEVNRLQADIAIIQEQIARTVVRAPFSGVVGLRQVSPGAYVTPQTVIASLQQLTNPRIDFTLPEVYSHLVKRGNTVVVEAGMEGVKRRATITAVEPQISTATRNLMVRANLQDASGINPGTFVKVFVEAGQDNSIQIPASAIIPDARAKQVVLVKEGKAKFVDIETGIRREGAVQVTNGLNNGDSVIVTGVLFARPNSPVKVRSVKRLEEVI